MSERCLLQFAPTANFSGKDRCDCLNLAANQDSGALLQHDLYLDAVAITPENNTLRLSRFDGSAPAGGSIASQPLRIAYREGLTSRLPQRLILLAIVDLSSEALLSTTAFASVGIHE